MPQTSLWREKPLQILYSPSDPSRRKEEGGGGGRREEGGGGGGRRG